MTTQPSDFRFDGDRVTLPDGWYVEFKSEYDPDHGAPWEEECGHGPVTDWVRRDKYAGERVLCSGCSTKRYYDFAEAMKIAKRDGWAPNGAELAELKAKLGHAPTKGQIIEAAVELDFKHLKDWCDDKWHYVGVIVTLRNPEGEEVDSEALWGVEDSGDYYQTVASELADDLIAKHELDVREDADFASRC